ncbi:MAG: bifunctional adenosylcobinamide kinase/adenosylcobinamide-phosphate guanylyltransferase [Coriobacteriales bacterium]|jgi:adenosylcobinamide kinase/adenosylcobinamide-phosphate guanylyltransferase|nr:bifunctional adenosylcobinamide kinase/adenosylcobinamide-phosphate guanylyltransferase [Coriobacteriales bacterium]
MRYLLTGGSACGKSSYAEKLAATLCSPRYLVFTLRPVNELDSGRLDMQRKTCADKGFQSIECYTDIGSLQLLERGTVIVDCLCNLSANELFDPAHTLRMQASSSARVAEVAGKILEGLEALERQSEHIIIVTNDVGSDGAKYDDSVLDYIRVLGTLNTVLAARYENVFEFCCGIPMVLKGELPRLES